MLNQKLKEKYFPPQCPVRVSAVTCCYKNLPFLSETSFFLLKIFNNLKDNHIFFILSLFFDLKDTKKNDMPQFPSDSIISRLN